MGNQVPCLSPPLRSLEGRMAQERRDDTRDHDGWCARRELCHGGEPRQGGQPAYAGCRVVRLGVIPHRVDQLSGAGEPSKGPMCGLPGRLRQIEPPVRARGPGAVSMRQS